PLSTLLATPEAPGTSAVPLRQSGYNRLGSRLSNQVTALLGTPSRRRLAQAALFVDRIRYWENAYSKLNDAELKQRGLQLRGRARGGDKLDQLLPEAFGLVCVAALRTTNLRPFDVQLAGGVVLHHGAIAELATGEGKTLTASMPAFLNALTGKGVHVTTVNDYLASRDAEWMGPIYTSLGLTVGVLQQQISDAAGDARRSDRLPAGGPHCPDDGARQALHPRREEAEDRADRGRPAGGALLERAGRPALACHGQAARAH